MKPLKLQFSGINSYRITQVVDFEQLGADGLFGIFGPTGSGKSSILDAITLALYGGVDRATNNTRGIIHQLEKTLEVSFEFELGGHRYLAERRYDRNPKDPDAAVAKQARLRRVGAAGEEVLASKPQEVTAKVEEILGIGRDEFSRAVVLPQGKFDQFLRLTGGDRAAMLEHLFNLEQFGEELVAKVKQVAAICTEQFQRIAGEEQGIGDCSAEAVQQAVIALKTKNEDYTGAQQAFAEVDQSYKEAMAIRELFLKRKTAAEKIFQLELEQETMTAKQARLNAAERAEPLRELIVRQQDLTKKIDAESIVYQNKVDSHSEAVTSYEAANQELAIAEKEYHEQLPQLQERKAQYQGAQEKQKKLQDLQKSIAEKKQELDQIKDRIANYAKEIATGKSGLDDARTALETLQNERSLLIVNPEEKEFIERALGILSHLEESEKHCQESKEVFTKRKSQNDNKWTNIVDKVQEMLPDQPVLAGDDLEKRSKLLLDKVEQDLENARKAHHHALIVNSAAQLVKELHDGEACPVCGSCEHPLPAQATDENDLLEAVIKAAEDRLREIRNWEGQLLKLWHDWNINKSLVDEARELMEQAATDFQGSLAEFETVRGTFGRDQLRIRKQELTDFEKRLHLIDQQREAMQQTQAGLNEKLQILTDSFQIDQIKEASAQAALKSFQTQLDEITEELNQVTGGKNLEGLIQDMVQTFQRLQKAVADTKLKEAETRAVLDMVAREIAALEATLAANRNELAAVTKRLTAGLEEAGFIAMDEAESVLLEPGEKHLIRQQFEKYWQEVAVAHSELNNLDREIDGRPFDTALFESITAQREELFQAAERLKTEVTLAKNKVDELQQKQERWLELQRQKTAAEKRQNLADDLGNLLRGRKFVSFLAQEHLRDMTLEASYQLGRLTGQRYALELAKEKDCEFVIRDDYNGGNRRMINSLSGGEVFMTSLALALALSSKIQLRGKYPLGFFFLDEGFGSLDEEKLDKVMSALEKLHDKNRMVGVISHVREMRERLPRYLEVVAAGDDGGGSRIRGV